MRIDIMSDADLAVAAASAGRHAVVWYLGLLTLLLAFEFFAWSVRRRHARHFEPMPVERPGLPALLGLGIALAAGASACFAGIAHAIGGQGKFVLVDQAFLDALRAGMPQRMVKDSAWITWFGDGRTLALLCIVAAAALLARAEKALTLAVLVAIGGNGIINAVLKRSFERVRPPHATGLPEAHGWSFPSGHASGAVVAYGILAYVLVRTLPSRWHLPVVMSATALAFSVGWSRIVLEAHFVSDVLAAFASGIAWLALVLTVTECWMRGWRPGTPSTGARGRSRAMT
jgi:undecaprenyl-diphosphatase